MSRFVTDPKRLKQLAAERFVPWRRPSWWSGDGKTRGYAEAGFVRNARFGSGQVIPGTNRAAQKKGGYQMASDSEAVR